MASKAGTTPRSGIWTTGWIALLLIFLGVAPFRIAVAAEAEASPPKKVYIFSAPACIYCYVAKKTFDKYGIPYEEFDISTSEAARNYFIKLGGQGTPLLIVNGKRMQGFDEQRFWALYGPPPSRPAEVSETDRKAGNDQPK